MNVGSILNKESPPSESEDAGASIHQGAVSSPSSSVTSARHSIVNILNDDPKAEEETRFQKPVSPTLVNSKPGNTGPPPAPIKRNSIADITNDKDFDLNTGKEVGELENSTSDIDLSDLKDGDDDFPNEDEFPKEYKNEEKNEKEEDELEKLKKIKNSAKPTRYKSPPIWAQEWIPPNQQNRHNHQNQYQNNVYGDGQPHSVLSDKRVFDYSSTPSVDLECSITGVIPPPSVTRTIAEWIFANFRDIPEQNRKYVELELKFGTITDKQRGKRINLNVTTECIYTDHSSVYFDMSVDEKAWTDITKLFQELEHNYQDELKKSKNPNKPKKKFTTTDADITDSFYQVGKPGEQPKKVRISKDNTLNPPRYSGIEKQRIADLFIHNPSSMYDLRLSLSLEMPVMDASVESLVAKSTPVLVREKKRNTWAHLQTVTRFDLTRVLVPRESKNNAGKKIVTHDKNYEIELEIDALEVFNAMDKVLHDTDRFRFEELVEIYINNARVLNNRVTKLALP